MHENERSATTEHRMESLKASVKNLVDAGGERADQLKHKAIDVKDAVVEGSGAAVRKVGSLIQEHPFIAIGIAFGIGYAVMRVMKMR